MEKAVIIALDFKDFEETRQFIEQFDESLYVKVGMELFYAKKIEKKRTIKFS